MQRDKTWYRVPSDLIDRMRKDENERRLPDPAEQADNLVLWVGRKQRYPRPGLTVDLVPQSLRAEIGAVDGLNVIFIAEALREKGLGVFDGTTAIGYIGLTFDGWQRYHQLTRESTSGPQAFMAMQYNDPILDEKIFPKFKSETEAAGFRLVKLTEVSRAGSIDEQLRVEIRRARFLVADLTHDNSGAYWEAGFAEGLDQPVIYTCEKGIFESRGTHFDTNHSHTILWDENDPVKAARELKATIRATLPDEARMDD
jgi:nucleoside 2-deoxyribosyltransferase